MKEKGNGGRLACAFDQVTRMECRFEKLVEDTMVYNILTEESLKTESAIFHTD